MASFAEFKDFKLMGVEVSDQILGRGSYADVLQLNYIGLKCAGKKIHSLLLKGEQADYILLRFAEECRLLSKVRHPNIVQFLGVHLQEGATIPILVMEYLPMTLTSCIDKYAFLPKEICYAILYDIALGLNYLHSQSPPIIHRDLSSNNILLTSNMTAKISDLGVAKMLELDQKLVMTKNPGTIAFMPPEVNMANPVYGVGVDEFSYGIIIIHLLCKQLPQPQIGPTFVDPESGKLIPVSEIDRRKGFIQMIGSDHRLMDLIVNCLNDNPNKRPHANEMVAYLSPLVSDQLCQLDVIKSVKNNEMALQEEKQCIEKEISKNMQEVQQKLNESAENLQELKERHKTKIEELQHERVTLIEEVETIQSRKQSIIEKLQKQEDRFSTTLQALKGIQQNIEHIHGQDMESADIDDSEKIARSKEENQPSGVNINQCMQEPITSARSPSNDFKSAGTSRMVEMTESDSGRKKRWTNLFMDKFKGRFAHKQVQPISKLESDALNTGTTIPSEVISETKDTCESAKVTGTTLYVGKYDYHARKSDELSFMKGDIMYITRSDGDWWYAQLRDSDQEGYVPSNFIAEFNSLNAEEWFFGSLESDKAKMLLMKPANPPGSYLVCENSDKHGSFTLFVRDEDKIITYPIIYREGQGYFVSPTISFNSIRELIIYHGQQGAECSIMLKYPCFLSDEKNEIDRNHLKVLDRNLESTVFGDVRQGLLKGTSVMVKILSTSRESCYRNFLHEAHVLQTFSHPNIIRLIGVCTRERPYYIVTEFLKHGSLLDYLNSCDGKSLQQSELIKMAAQIVSGMLQLEVEDCVHRNLSAQNVLVGESLVCKVSNFHFAQAKHVEENFPIRSATKWAAPEVLTNQMFSSKSDVWSFGIVLYELITHGKAPYTDMKDREVMQKVTLEMYHMPCPKGCPSKLYGIMQSCWKYKPAHRPSFTTLQLELEKYWDS